ncbi:MAG: hypothetical protein WCF19_04930 [Chlamydiales bacterium]
MNIKQLSLSTPLEAVYHKFLKDIPSSPVNEKKMQEQCCKQVKECVQVYARPNSLLGYIPWLVQRVWQAVKGIFGYSTWQTTRQLISSTILELMDKKLKADFGDEIAGLLPPLVDLALQTLVTIENWKAEPSKELLKHFNLQLPEEETVAVQTYASDPVGVETEVAASSQSQPSTLRTSIAESLN